MRGYHKALSAAGIAALICSPWIVPQAVQSTALLLRPDDVASIVEYRLSTQSPQQFQDAIDQALVDRDPELAASLLEVAANAPMPADLTQRVADAQGFDAGRIAGEIWDGVFKGDTSSEAALGGSLLADFTGAGDVRDLVLEGNNYLSNGLYDPVVLTLAIAGLAMTAATVLTAGGAAPARTGITVLKAAKKAGNLPAPLVSELTKISVNAIDRNALDQTINLTKSLDFSGAGAASGRILNPSALRTVTTLADDIAAIAGQSGYRAVNQSLNVATSTADITKLRRLAGTTGTKFRGILKVLGGSALSLAGLTFTLAGWAFSGLVWLVAAGFAVFGLVHLALRWILKGRKSAGKIQAPT